MEAQELRDRSQQFALDVIRFCDTLPKDRRTQEVAEQLQDASASTSMNYGAACRARSPAEFIAKICVTVEEADEAQGWPQLLVESRKTSSPELQRLLRESTELVKIFAASKRTSIANHEAAQNARDAKRQRRNPRSR
jgi:four helix bundle protein